MRIPSFRAFLRAYLIFAFFIFSSGRIGAEPSPYPQFSAHGTLLLSGFFGARAPDVPCFDASLNAGITGALSPRLSVDLLADNARIAIQSVYTSTNLLAALRYETDPAQRMQGSVLWSAPFGVEFEGCFACCGREGASFEGQAGLSLGDILGLRDAPYAISATGGVSLSAQGSAAQVSVYGAGSADFLPSFTYSRQTRAQSAYGIDWRESGSHLDISGTLFSVCSWSYSRDVYRSASAGSEAILCAQSARIFAQILEEAPLLAHTASLGAGCVWASAREFSLLGHFSMNSASADGKRNRAIDVQCAYRRESAAGAFDIQAECQYSWASGIRAALRYDAVISELPEQNCTLAVSITRQRAAYQTEFTYAAAAAEARWNWRHSLTLGVGESWAFEALLDCRTPPAAATLTLSLAYQLL